MPMFFSVVMLNCWVLLFGNILFFEKGLQIFLDGSSKFFSFTNGMPRNLDSGPLGYLICDTYLTGFKYQS